MIHSTVAKLLHVLIKNYQQAGYDNERIAHALVTSIEEISRVQDKIASIREDQNGLKDIGYYDVY